MCFQRCRSRVSFERVLLLTAAIAACGASFAVAEEPFPQSISGEIVEMVVASVDGEPVTLGEVRRHIRTRGGEEPANLARGGATARRYVVDLVAQKLLVREANDLGLSVSEDEIDSYIARLREQNGLSEKEFQAVLAQRNLTLSEYERQVKSEILRSRVLSNHVRNKIQIVDEDIERYLEKHPGRRPEPGQVRLRQMTLAAGEADRDAKELRARLVNPGRGGAVRDLGYVRVADLRKEIATRLGDAKEGDIVGPLTIGGETVVYEVVSKVTEEEPIDEALREEIRGLLLRERFEAAAEEYLSKELPEKYAVEFFL